MNAGDIIICDQYWRVQLHMFGGLWDEEGGSEVFNVWKSPASGPEMAADGFFVKIKYGYELRYT